MQPQQAEPADQARDDAQLLAPEWDAYRAACDAVDAAEETGVRNPASNSAIEATNAVWENRQISRAYDRAVQASALLLERAAVLDVDPDWLADLRESHRRLQLDAAQHAARGALIAQRRRELQTSESAPRLG